jgi:hypothetical protein
MTISRVNTFSYPPYAREMNVLFNQANVFVEFCQMKYFRHLCLQNYYFGTSLELSLLTWKSVI